MSDRSTNKRDAAIQAAVPVFRIHGYSGASISMLVEATGQSRSTLYSEFGDKGGLFTAALDHYCGTWRDLADGTTARDFLTQSVKRLSKSEVGLPCLLTRSCLELGDLPPEAQEIVAGALENQWNQLIEAETAATSSGQDPVGSATRDLALRHGLAALAAAGVPTKELLASL